MNFLPCQLAEGGAVVEGQRVPLSTPLLDKASGATNLEIGIRPEAIRLDGAGGLDVEIRGVDDLGTRKIVTCRLGTYELKVKVRESQETPVGRCSIEFDPAMVRLYADGHLVS